MPRAFDDKEAEILREALLRAGRRSIVKVGLRRSRIEDWVAEVGISKGAFYRFFDRKEDLLLAVMQEGEQALRQRLSQALSLEQALTELFVGFQDDPAIAALSDAEDMAWLMRSVPPEQLGEAQADDKRWFGAWQQDLVTRGLLREDLAPDTLLGLAGAALALAQGRRLIGEERSQATIAQIVRGLVLSLAPLPVDAGQQQRP